MLSRSGETCEAEHLEVVADVPDHRHARPDRRRRRARAAKRAPPTPPERTATFTAPRAVRSQPACAGRHGSRAASRSASVSTSSARFGIAAATTVTPSACACARNRSALPGAVERREERRRGEARARSSSRPRPRRARARARASPPASARRSRGTTHGTSAFTTSTGPIDSCGARRRPPRPGRRRDRRRSRRRARRASARSVVVAASRATVVPRTAGGEHVAEHRERERRALVVRSGPSRCLPPAPRKGTTIARHRSWRLSGVENADDRRTARGLRRAARAERREPLHRRVPTGGPRS